MADNFAIAGGTAGTAAADDLSGVLFQRVKLIHGNDGTNIGDVSPTNPFPVVGYPCYGTDYQSGYGTATSTGAVPIVSAPGTGTYLYVTGILLHNSSTTDTLVALLNGTTTVGAVPAPAKGGAAFPCMIKCSTGSAFQIAEGAVVSAIYCSAWGFKSTV